MRTILVSYEIVNTDHDIEVDEADIIECQSPEEVKTMLLRRIEDALKWANLDTLLSKHDLDAAVSIWKNSRNQQP